MEPSKSGQHFGLVIAYLLPGFVGLAGIAPFAPTIAAWLLPHDYAQASLGPPTYVLIAATTFGLLVSCIRWVLIDHVHWATGLVPPRWDDRRLEKRLFAFDYLVESHYRYYQFVANLLVAAGWTYAVHRWLATSPYLGTTSDVAFVLLCAVLFAASRDALAKYYTRTGRLVGQVFLSSNSGEPMYNGNHHAAEGGATTSKPATPKSDAKPAATPAPKADVTKGKSPQNPR
jgi:hypothetical protein